MQLSRVGNLCLAAMLSVCMIIATSGTGFALDFNQSFKGKDFSGPYVGAGAGTAHFNIETNSTEGYSADGATYGAKVGYGILTQDLGLEVEDIYFGLEGTYDANSAEYKETFSTGSIKFETGTSYGLNARAGYVDNNMMAFGLIGWQSTDIEYKYKDSFFGKMSDEQTFSGIRLGVGFEYQTPKYVFLRGQYTYTMYGEETFDYDLATFKAEPDAGNAQLMVGVRF
jgi:outer membrane immunogenic protein